MDPRPAPAPSPGPGEPARGPLLPGPGGAVTVTPAQMAAFRQQQQQRPQNNMSSFVFLSILFFLLSNNGNEDPTAEVATLDKLKGNLERREMRRDGLAQWLGLNTTRTSTSTSTSTNSTQTALAANGTATATGPTPIPFVPTPHANAVLVPRLHALLDPPAGTLHPLHFAQNLTGLGKGRWSIGDWDWDSLRIPEAYNTTEVVDVTPRASPKPKPPRVFAEQPAAEGAKPDVPAAANGDVPEPRDPLVRRAELSELDTKPGLERVDVPPPAVPRVFENVTRTTNRTLARGQFPWAAGGKVTFQLVEDQSSAVGAVVLPTGTIEDGKLLVEREGPREPWEEQGPVTYLRGDITIYPKDGTDSIALDVEGVHFLSQGTFYAFATPSTLPTTFAFEVPGLPLFDASSLPSANLSAYAAGHAILREVDRRIRRDRAELAANADNLSPLVTNTAVNPFSTPEPECTFTLYGRLSALPAWYSPGLYAEYYLSLFHPTGSSLVAPPKTMIEYVLYSEPCGLVLEGAADMTPIPEAWSRATNLATLLGIVQGVMLYLLVRQMTARASPNSLAKLAHATIGMQAAMDSYTFIATFTVSVAYNSRASFPTLVPCFFALVGSLCFGMRHASDIRSSYPPPAPRPPRPPPPTREALAASAAERRAAGDTAPPPAPVIVVTNADDDSDTWYLAIGITIAVSVLFVVIVWGWIALMMVVFYSYWIPQILMNVQRGAARMTLKREYIVGTTLGRLFLPVYFLGCPSNLLGAEPTRWVYPLVLYSAFQAAVLLTQDSRLGARFFVPHVVLRRLGLTTEAAWEYHPLLGLDLEGGLVPEDCPICMEPIELGDKEDRELGLKGRARWAYMVPPCHHTCHTQCLESWMQIKNVCPVCRGRLPPL